MEEDQGQNLFNVRILTFFFSECQIFHNYEIRVRILKKQQQKNRDSHSSRPMQISLHPVSDKLKENLHLLHTSILTKTKV